MSSYLPDPYWDSPEQTGTAYVPHRPRQGMCWLFRDPEFPDRALIGVQPALTKRTRPVQVSVYLDLPKGTRIGGFNPLIPILAGTLHVDNQFVKRTKTQP